MFGIIADLIAAATTILLPAYLSYKAIRTSDPAQLTPWLIYFVLLALTLLAESWTVFVLGWVPFYSWFRLFFLLYLVLPQTQGAKVLYLTYVEPFIVQHERAIDEFIGDLHAKLETAGLGYLGQLVDIVREKVLGQTAPAIAGLPAATAGGYAQSLLSRFTMPDARAANPSNVYGMLSAATGYAAAATTSSRARDFSSSEPINPPSIPQGTAAEKSNYISTQRAHLTTLLKALDKEQQTLDLAYGDTRGPLPKSQSEASFEDISYSDSIPPSLIPGQGQKQPNVSSSRHTPSGGWVSNWFTGSGAAEEKDNLNASRPSTGRSVSGSSSGNGRNSGSQAWSAARDITDAVQGMSSGIDKGY